MLWYPTLAQPWSSVTWRMMCGRGAPTFGATRGASGAGGQKSGGTAGAPPQIMRLGSDALATASSSQTAGSIGALAA